MVSGLRESGKIGEGEGVGLGLAAAWHFLVCQ